jgi:hypothetical protein
MEKKGKRSEAGNINDLADFLEMLPEQIVEAPHPSANLLVYNPSLFFTLCNKVPGVQLRPWYIAHHFSTTD